MTKVIKEIFSKINIYQLRKSQTNLLIKCFTDKTFVSKMPRHPLHASIAEWLPIETNRHVLELGCGPGKYVAMLSSLGFKVTGVDPISFPTWNILKERESIKLISDVFAENLPFDDCTFDHVVCLSALYYFDDPLKAMLEVQRVIKPGGRVIIRTVNSNNFYTINTGKSIGPAQKNLYDMEDLSSLVQNAGLRVMKHFSYGFWPPVFADFWWYLQCVWIPVSVQNILSNLINEKYRVNNIMFCQVEK